MTYLNRAEKVWIETQENYNKRSYRNRAHIASANGKQRLSIPLRRGKNEQMPIRKVEIAYEENWQVKHWRTIQSAYQRAPYFEFYADDLQSIYEQEINYLFDWNLELLRYLMQTLQIEKTLHFTDTYLEIFPPNFTDYRNKIDPKEKSEFQISQHYPQVFMEKHGFIPNLSSLDLLFCTGPEAPLYL